MVIAFLKGLYPPPVTARVPPLITIAPVTNTWPLATDEFKSTSPAFTVNAPVNMLAPEKTTVPLFVASPTVTLLAPPLIMPLKVTVFVVAAAISLVPEPKVMLLLIVLAPVHNKVPPLIVTVPVERLVPLVPPVATDKAPPEMEVPPV